MTYWSNFVYYDNPNHKKNTREKGYWQTFKRLMQKKEYIVFSEAGCLMKSTEESESYGHNCELWDSEKINKDD